MVLLRIAVASLLFVLIGRGALRGAAEGRSGSVSGRLALEGTVGLVLAVPIFFLIARFGWPVDTPGVIVGLVLLAALFAVLPVRHSRPDVQDLEELPASWLSSAVLIAALALFVFKIWHAPLWSWDHYAVWGVKARRMVVDGGLDLSFLRLAPFRGSHPSYAPGFPLAWRLLCLGAMPGEAQFKACHILFGLALAFLVRAASLESGAPPPAADAFAAFAAASPLFWDTEAAGLAEMPLALAAAGGVLLLLRFRNRRPALPVGLWMAGGTLGFLAWIKGREGLALTILAGLAGTLLLAGKTRSIFDTLLRLWLPASVSVGLSIAAVAGLPAGERFLVGDWRSRALTRLQEAPRMGGWFARELLRADWLGFWVLFAAATAAAWLLRRKTAALLCAVVWCQLALYSLVYFVTYLDPEAHIKSSFFRISAALVPLGAIAASSLFSNRESVQTRR